MNEKSSRVSPPGNGRPPPLNALRAFEAAARHLSFKKAALELHVTPGAVSHQVKLLEGYLGVALFRRLTRALELTAAAQAMLPKVRGGLDSLVEAVEMARVRRGHLTLAVVAPPNFAARWLIPRLSRFTDAHPELDLHLASSPTAIDTGDEVHEVPSTEEDTGAPVAMVRFGDGRYPGSRVDEVFSAVYVPACSPKVLARGRPLRTPQDLRFHTLVHDDTEMEEGAKPTWGDWLQSVGVTDVDASRGPRFSNASLAFEAALEGMGVALVMKPLVSAEIESGRLVVPFDIAAPATFAYYLVTREASANVPAVKAFREWLLAESAAQRG